MGTTTRDALPWPENTAPVRSTGTAIRSLAERVELVKSRIRSNRALYQATGGSAGTYSATAPIETWVGYSTQVSSSAGLLSVAAADIGASWSAIIAAFIQPMSDGGATSQAWYGVLRPDQGNTATVRWVARTLAAGNAVVTSANLHFAYLIVAQP